MYLPKPLVQGSTLTTAAAVYYTAPTGVSTRITQMSVTNTDSVARTISIYVCASSAAPGTVDTSIKSKTLQPNETWVPYQVLGTVLSAGGTLQALADANSVVVMKASGIELTS
jgi:hypothetical protein